MAESKDPAGRGEAAVKLIRAQIMSLQAYDWIRCHGERRYPDPLETGCFHSLFPKDDIVALFPAFCVCPIHRCTPGTVKRFFETKTALTS
jgi:hypothetical protein